RLRIALGHQLLVGLQHGVARELRLAREHPARRQARTRGEPAVEDRGAQRAIGLAIERAVAIEREPHPSEPASARIGPRNLSARGPFPEPLRCRRSCGARALAEDPMKLYSGPLSLFTAKVRIALDEKALACERIEVGWSLRDRYLPHHPDVAALNPKRQVPVL